MADPSGDLGGGDLGGGGDAGGGGGLGGDPSDLDGGIDPIPYPEIDGGDHEPIKDVKIDGEAATTTTSSAGDDPGATKDIVSFGSGAGDVSALPVGSVNVTVELGMVGITGSPGMMNNGTPTAGSSAASDSEEGDKESKEGDETVQIEEEGGSSFWDPSSRYPDETDGLDPMTEFGKTFEQLDAVETTDVMMEKDAFFDLDG